MPGEHFENKLVAVLNKSIETPLLMNALAHMTVGLGASIGEKNLMLCKYQDANNGIHPNISAMPFIILKTNSNKIRQLKVAAIENKILYSDFTNTMTTGGYKAQMELTKQTKEEDLTYFGIVLFGKLEIVNQLTKKFSLYK